MAKALLRRLPLRVLGLALCGQVENVDRPTLDDRAPGHRAAAERKTLQAANNQAGDRPPRRDQPERVTLDPKDVGLAGVADPRRGRGNLIQDRLQVSGRAADDPENLGCGRLLLERLGQLGIARLELLEQAHVLDRDDGLLGEGLGLAPADRHSADRLPGPEHGNSDLTPRAQRLDHSPGECRHALLMRDIPDVGWLSRRNNSPDNGVVARRSWKHTLELASAHGTQPMARHDVNQRTIVAVYAAESRAAQTYSALHDDIEYRLDVGGGARDNPQDLGGRRLLLERHGQLAVARLQFLKEADVLDRDDGLVGEGLDEVHLGCGEPADLPAIDRQCAEEPTILDQRDVEKSPESFLVDTLDPHLVTAPVRLRRPDVFDLAGAPGACFAEEGPPEPV